MNLETVHGFISSKNLRFNVNKDFQHKQNMFCIQGFPGSVSGRDGNGEAIFGKCWSIATVNASATI